jgi:hypothetical protein
MIFKTWNRFLLCASGLSLLCIGCERGASPQAPAGAPAGAQVVVEPPASLSWVEGYPNQSTRFTAGYLAPTLNTPASSPLRAAPLTDAAQVAELKLDQGVRLAWRRSVVVIEEPRVFIAQRDVTLDELKQAKPHERGFGAPRPSLTLKQGDTLHLHHRIEQGCYISLPGQEWLLGRCPERPDFENPTRHPEAPMAPLRAERDRWWTLVERDGAMGWLEVKPGELELDVDYERVQ